MLRRVSRLTACLLLLSVCLVPPARAQVNNASVTGLVTDAAGAVVPNASVTLRNRATSVETSATTDSSGYYTFAMLRERCPCPVCEARRVADPGGPRPPAAGSHAEHA